MTRQLSAVYLILVLFNCAQDQLSKKNDYGCNNSGSIVENHLCMKLNSTLDLA